MLVRRKIILDDSRGGPFGGANFYRRLTVYSCPEETRWVMSSINSFYICLFYIRIVVLNLCLNETGIFPVPHLRQYERRRRMLLRIKARVMKLTLLISHHFNEAHVIFLYILTLVYVYNFLCFQ